jgi:hypothetical protein
MRCISLSLAPHLSVVISAAEVASVTQTFGQEDGVSALSVNRTAMLESA